MATQEIQPNIPVTANETYRSIVVNNKDLNVSDQFGGYYRKEGLTTTNDLNKTQLAGTHTQGGTVIDRVGNVRNGSTRIMFLPCDSTGRPRMPLGTGNSMQTLAEIFNIVLRLSNTKLNNITGILSRSSGSTSIGPQPLPSTLELASQIFLSDSGGRQPVQLFMNPKDFDISYGINGSEMGNDLKSGADEVSEETAFLQKENSELEARVRTMQGVIMANGFTRTARIQMNGYTGGVPEIAIPRLKYVFGMEDPSFLAPGFVQRYSGSMPDGGKAEQAKFLLQNHLFPETGSGDTNAVRRRTTNITKIKEDAKISGYTYKGRVYDVKKNAKDFNDNLDAYAEEEYAKQGSETAAGNVAFGNYLWELWYSPIAFPGHQPSPFPNSGWDKPASLKVKRYLGYVSQLGFSISAEDGTYRDPSWSMTFEVIQPRDWHGVGL